MITLRIPSTSANIGVGFDCLGIAFDLYNYFDIELSHQDELLQVEKQFQNKDNLFLKSYHYANQKLLHMDDHIRVTFDIHVPISRGLGSSATLIVGGVLASYLLHKHQIPLHEFFKCMVELEGHPDNIAPCLYGGFQTSIMKDDIYTFSLPISQKLHFLALIPNYQTSTAQARKVLPSQYSKADVCTTLASLSATLHCLAVGDMDKLKKVLDDRIHEPYRKHLIADFTSLETLLSPIGKLIISGSGSTMLLIHSDDPNHLLNQVPSHISVLPLQIDFLGSAVKEGTSWTKII